MIFAILYIDRLKCEHVVDQETGKLTIIFEMITYGEGPGRMGRSITAAPIFLVRNVGAQLSVEDSSIVEQIITCWNCRTIILTGNVIASIIKKV